MIVVTNFMSSGMLKEWVFENHNFSNRGAALELHCSVPKVVQNVPSFMITKSRGRVVEPIICHVA